VEEQIVRALVFDCLRLHTQDRPQATFQLSDVELFVFGTARQKGYLPSDTAQLPAELADLIREITWALAIQGIIVPGIDNRTQTNLPWLHVTEYGKRCLASGEFLPHDVQRYLERLREEVSTLDSVALMYLTESLQCFRSGNYLASGFMLGVAAERGVLVLSEAVAQAIADPGRKAKFEGDIRARPIKKVHKAVWNKIDPIMEQLPPRLADIIPVQLDGIYQLIRQNRNDAGHPTGRVIGREEANALLQLFPTYVRTVYTLIGWLSQNRI
jgi:hypothetical protein